VSDEYRANSGSEYRDVPLRRGTRLIRVRTARRVPQQGQPDRPLTHPRIPHAGREEHVCAECFGPRSRYRDGQFCARCERDLFGDSRDGYGSFIRSERARNVQAARKRAREAAS
jgi:hypothetical protein